MQGLHVFDVSDPANPVNVGNLPIPSSNVRVFGGRAYLANGIRLVVVDVTDPASPLEIGSAFPTSRIVDMVEYGSIVYATTEHRGLKIVDVSDPTQPVVVSTLPMEAYGRDLALSGSFLYLATFESPTDLTILDISDPIAPKAIGTIEEDIGGVAVDGSFIYMTSSLGLITAPIQCEATSGILSDTKQGPGLLGAAYPNPVRSGRTIIPFTVSRFGMVELRVYDIAGREVRALVNEALEPGDQVASWDGTDKQGRSVPGGIYFYQLRMAGLTFSRKLVRLP